MIYRQSVDPDKYFIVTYLLVSKTTLHDAAWALAVGQSVGNPHARNRWETDELFEDHSCKIIGDEQRFRSVCSGFVEIAFPAANLDIRTDGVTQLLVHMMGGQLDIDIIDTCQVFDIRFPPSMESAFLGPRYGIEGVRRFTGVHGKPLLGGIVKPKVGIGPDTLLELVKELVDGGVDFIKEDEIMSNPACCPLEARLPPIMNFLRSCGRNVVYAVCINSDYPHVIDRVKRVDELGGNAVHINFWNGLGVYKAVRELDLPLFLFFQKSGDKVLTNPHHAFHISWRVICKLASMMGVDFIHAGMWGGYMSEEESELRMTIDQLVSRGTMPSLSCGMHPGLVQAINRRFGVDYMANVGGAIHAHPGGTVAGARAMKQAIDGIDGPEYWDAIAKWGLVT